MKITPENSGNQPTRLVFPEIYEELRNIASYLFRAQSPDHTLQPTAVVHEAFIKLTEGNSAFKDRNHFLATSAKTMRHVLVDHARGKNADCRGGGWHRVTLSGVNVGENDQPVDVLALDEALVRLAGKDESRASVVEMRVFGGMSIGEIAEVLNISPRTVDRYWQFARAWLDRELYQDQVGNK